MTRARLLGLALLGTAGAAALIAGNQELRIGSGEDVPPASEAAAPAARSGAAGRAAETRAALAVAGARLAAVQHGPAEAAALAAAVRDYEAGLAGLRDGIGAAYGEARAVAVDLAVRDAELRRLVAMLSALGAGAGAAEAEAPHPGGPLAAARAAAMLAHARPALEAETAAIAGRLADLAAARRLEAEGEAELAAGLARMAEARARLVALAPAVSADPGGPDAELAALMRRSDTLTEFAAGVEGLAVTKSSRNIAPAPAGAAADGPRLAVPVAGRLLRDFGEADGGGIARPGLTFAAAPLAIVTAPVDGEVRYAGPFLDYGYVAIIEPAPGTLVILAGLGQLHVRTGDTVEAGGFLGLLGGRALDAQEFLMLAGGGNDVSGAETLYMELRHDGAPVDPGPFMAAANG